MAWKLIGPILTPKDPQKARKQLQYPVKSALKCCHFIHYRAYEKVHNDRTDTKHFVSGSANRHA